MNGDRYGLTILVIAVLAIAAIGGVAIASLNRVSPALNRESSALNRESPAVGNSPPDPAVTRNQLSEQQIASILSQLETKRSARVKFEYAISGSKQHGAGTVVYGKRGSKANLKMNGPLSTHLIFLDDEGFITGDRDIRHLARPWSRVEPHGRGPGLFNYDFLFRRHHVAVEPGILFWFTGLRQPFVYERDEVVGSHKTKRYTAVAERPDLLRGQTPKVQRGYWDYKAEIGHISLGIWVGDDGTLWKQTLSVSNTDGPNERLTATYDQWGVDAQISAPPKNKVEKRVPRASSPTRTSPPSTPPSRKIERDVRCRPEGNPAGIEVVARGKSDKPNNRVDVYLDITQDEWEVSLHKSTRSDKSGSWSVTSDLVSPRDPKGTIGISINVYESGSDSRPFSWGLGSDCS